MAIFNHKDVICVICGESARRPVTAKIDVCSEICRGKFYKLKHKANFIQHNISI